MTLCQCKVDGGKIIGRDQTGGGGRLPPRNRDLDGEVRLEEVMHNNCGCLP